MAFSYPVIISFTWTPYSSLIHLKHTSIISSSAFANNSPANVTTKLVPSPTYTNQSENDSHTSSSCFFAASTISFAAGWTTSISFTIVAVSLVMNILSSWLITSLNMPRITISTINHTIWTQRCPMDRRKLFACINITNDCILCSRKRFVSVSKQSTETSSRIHLSSNFNHFALYLHLSYKERWINWLLKTNEFV